MKSTLFIFLIKILKNNIKKITTAQIIGHGVLHAKNIMNTINFFFYCLCHGGESMKQNQTLLLKK